MEAFRGGFWLYFQFQLPEFFVVFLLSFFWLYFILKKKKVRDKTYWYVYIIIVITDVYIMRVDYGKIRLSIYKKEGINTKKCSSFCSQKHQKNLKKEVPTVEGRG